MWFFFFYTLNYASACLTQPISYCDLLTTSLWDYTQEIQFSSAAKSRLRKAGTTIVMSVGGMRSVPPDNWALVHLSKFHTQHRYSNSPISHWFRTHNSYPADWPNFHPTRLWLPFFPLPCFFFLSLFQSLPKRGYIKPLSSELSDVGIAIDSAKRRAGLAL